MSPEELKKMIAQKLPEGLITPRHDEKGHWYYVPSLDKTFPSITGKLSILKDPSLKNYAVNENNKYIFEHFKEFTDENIMEHLDKAKGIAEFKRDTAGDFGTEIHDIRQRYFSDWIANDERPEKTLFEYVPMEMSNDPRAISCVRALNKFLIDTLYIPIACELLLYDERYEVAGTLDDIGLIRRVIFKGDPQCNHDYIFGTRHVTCFKCGYRLSGRQDLVLLDLKTSNQLKDHYWLQVCCYLAMFRKLTKINILHAYILKISKEDGTYILEKIKQPLQIMRYCQNFLKLCNNLEHIKLLRREGVKRLGRPLTFNNKKIMYGIGKDER